MENDFSRPFLTQANENFCRLPDFELGPDFIVREPKPENPFEHPLVMASPSRQGSKMAANLEVTIEHFFPDLADRLSRIKDPRKKCDYTIPEIVFAAISLFMLKQDSRNALNNKRAFKRFKNNFRNLFGLRLPHMDTVDEVLRRLEPEELDRLKALLVRILVQSKAIAKYRFFGEYYLVAIDATGVMPVSAKNSEGALRKTSKNGVVTYFRNVLEAKLITPNGFAISLATEWLENTGEYDKQDCELKAFARLSAKLKKYFPRLPICILGDGLYPNNTFFDICKEKGWRYIVTLRDKSLKSVWEELSLRPLNTKTKTLLNKREQVFQWTSKIDYQEHQLNWLECIETKGEAQNRFVYVTDLIPTAENIEELSEAGRLRFKIENEGFNTQKNLGLSLGHKFSRTSYQATKNYYQAMQIAHLFLQLFQLSQLFKPLVKAKMTIKALWERLTACLIVGKVSTKPVRRFQIRYE